MSKYLNLKIFSIAIVIASMLFFITDVFAQGISNNVPSHPSLSNTSHTLNRVPPTSNTHPYPSTNSHSSSSISPITHACKGRTLAIKNRSSNLIKLINTTVSKFGTITSRIEQYYQNTLSTNGKTLSNYILLTSTISQNKDSVLAEETTLENEYSNFTCSSLTNFKSETQSFNQNLITTLNLLKAYRSSIITLIVDLKTL